MSEPSLGDVTRLLRRWHDGDEAAMRDLVPLVHGELRRLARAKIAREPAGASLQPTELVHEAYLRLANAGRVAWRDRAHFLAVSAKVMRRILVDRARRKKARGGGGRVSIDSANLPAAVRGVDLLALDEALRDLADAEPRAARCVELRFFAGLTNAEIAEVNDVSEATVKRDMTLALAWLARALRRR